MTQDWEAYAQTHPITEESYKAEPTQWARVEKLLDRCVGSVLDVGGGDGYIARRLMDRGHKVVMLEASETRVKRAVLKYGVDAFVADDLKMSLGYYAGPGSYDTVLLGEVLEHQDDPGLLLQAAFRIARERVIITVPLQGWADPTHQWRISLDHLVTRETRPDRPPSSEQIIVTWQRGECWPLGYQDHDPKWHAQFMEGK